MQIDCLADQIQTTQRFDIIADLTTTSFTPPVGTLWLWKQDTEKREVQFPNWGLTVFVNDGEIRKAYFCEATNSPPEIKQHARGAKTIEEAVQIIVLDRDGE